MEEEKNWGIEVNNDSAETFTSDSNNIYENINKLKNKLDELAGTNNQSINIDSQNNMEFSDEISSEPIVEENINNDSVLALDEIPVNEEVVNNEISIPTVSAEEINKELEPKKEGKGQYILITILTIILISLLLLIVYFTNSL